MYCTKCGKKDLKVGKYCIHCGAKLAVDEPLQLDTTNNQKNGSEYIWAYCFEVDDHSNLSGLAEAIEEKGDYNEVPQGLKDNILRVYQKGTGKKSASIILFEQSNKVYIFGNSKGNMSARARYLNKHFKKLEKIYIPLQKIKSAEVKKIIEKFELAPGDEKEGPVGFGGWLYIPVINFLFIVPISTFAVAELGVDWLTTLRALLSLYSIYSAILLIGVKHGALRHAKIVLWIILIFDGLIGTAIDPSTAGSYIVWPIVWLLYFYKSVRVKNTYLS